MSTADDAAQPGVKFEQLAEQSWRLSAELGAMTRDDRFAALIEEVGELAQALLIERNVKSAGDGGDDLEVAFAGVLFELLVLARLYDVDVLRGYRRGVAMLQRPDAVATRRSS